MRVTKMFCVGFTLLAMSATASAEPYRCTYGQGKRIYEQAKDRRVRYLNALWNRSYDCYSIENFSRRAQTDLSETGPVNRMCKNAGINDAGIKVSSEKQSICGFQDGFWDGVAAAKDYCNRRDIPDMSQYEYLYEETCYNVVDVLTNYWCPDTRSNDPYFWDYADMMCEL